MLSNAMLKEYPVTQANVNKVSKVSRGAPAGVCTVDLPQVFCSQWLSHKQVIFGTKCNKLMVLDVNTRHMDQIPSLQSSENSVPPDQVECGVCRRSVAQTLQISLTKTI